MGPTWVAHMGSRSCPHFPQILPTLPPIWAPYWFVHLFHMGPMCVTHMVPIFCLHFPKVLPTFPPIRAIYGETWAPHGTYLGNYMGLIWATHMGPIWVCPSVSHESHVGCPYGSQILPTISPDLTPHFHPYGSHMGLSFCFIWVPCGFPTWLQDPVHIFPRSCPHIRPYGPHMVKHGLLMGPIWPTIWALYG